MAAGNYSIVKASQITGLEFGGTAWSAANYTSTSTTLESSFDTNCPTVLANLIGIRDANNPVKSAPFVKEISFSGNERNITEENLLGSDSTGAQNQEVIGGSVSKIECELTMVYRNNVPLSLFNDSTKCALMTIDTEESSTTGKMNFAMNDITVMSVGELSQAPDGLMEQKMKFTFSGGTTGTPITVTQGGQTWYRVAGGKYAEEIRMT
jgi:hypothetical protein